MTTKLLNPRTGDVLAEISPLASSEREARLTRADFAFSEWRQFPISQRMDHVRALAKELHQARESLAQEMSLEMGKSSVEALAEVEKARATCEALVELLPKWAQGYTYSEKGRFEVVREPLGVILGVMPWNFPLWQVIRFAVPAIGLGNTVLLKHAPNVWGFSQKLEELFSRAGFVKGVYQDFPIEVSEIPAIVADVRVRGASLTGSRAAGASLAEVCGRHLKKCVLELGGSDPYLIFSDADLELAADVCARSRLQNAGQSCIAAKRFIVSKKVATEFTKIFVRRMQEIEAKGEDGRLAPMARADLRSALHGQVERSLQSGARLECGGEIPPGPGFFYPATVLSSVRPGSPAFDEELFGPVAAIITAEDDAEMIELANQTIYGLGAALFSRDVERAYALARKDLEAGMVFVNEMVRSHFAVPFGGIKDSGIGRELGPEGSVEFTNLKLLFKP